MLVNVDQLACRYFLTEANISGMCTGSKNPSAAMEMYCQYWSKQVGKAMDGGTSAGKLITYNGCIPTPDR